MNKFLLLGTLLFFAFQLEAQSLKEKEIPTSVTSKVSSLYPQASKMTWEQVDGLYEAEFVSNQVETTLLLSSDGRLLLTETAMDPSALPGKIKEYVASHHLSSAISEASKIVDVTGRVTYEVEADDLEYVFDAKGQFVSQQLDEADEHDKK